MTVPELYPLNDFALLVTLYDVTSPAGTVVPLTTGPVTAFLATSESPTATVAESTLVGTVAYTGAGGVWLITIDAALLTPTLMAATFASATPWLILQKVDGVRAAIKCKYVASRKVTVA